MIPDAVDGAVESGAALQVGHRLVELPRGEIAVPAPAIQQRVVRCDADAACERRDRLAILPDARLRDAERDDLLDVARIGRQRALGARDGAGVALRPVLHTGGRAVFDGLKQAEWCEEAE